MRRAWQLMPTFTAFHAEQLTSWDIDPVYPVLRHVLTHGSWDTAQRVWAGLLHVAYYDLGSALKVFAHHPTPELPHESLLRIPCGTERRAHRDPRVLARHLAALTDLARLHGGLDTWLRDSIADGGYPAATATLMSVWGNGRWATYKSCELLAHLLGDVDPWWLTLMPTDMGHAHSSGPRHGLELLLPGQLPSGNDAASVAYLDAVSADLAADLAAAGYPTPIAMVETSLCDFHSLVGGRYYTGHDIDQMQLQLDRTGSTLTPAAFNARAATLPVAYLGEHHGWTGPEPALRRHYAVTGDLVTRLNRAGLHR